MTDLEKLDNVIQELDVQSNNLRAFNAIYAEIAKLQGDLAENLILIKESNEQLSEVSKVVNKRMDAFQKKIDEIYQDNKTFYKELDQGIFSRLEKHKYDLQNEIRNESTEIRQSLGNVLNHRFNLMETKVKEGFDLQINQMNTMKIMNIFLIAVVLGLLVAMLVNR